MQDKTSCESCPSKAVEIDDPWLTHILELDLLKQAGFRFALGDLDMAEAHGLKLLTLERNRFQHEKMKDFDDAKK